MYKSLKRLFDIVAAIIALILLSPLILLVIGLLKFTGEGEVLFRQQRLGYQNQYFYIWKFATMLKNSSSLGTGEVTVKNDPRVTNIGRFLRITKMNELPQLINILTGEMSFVGPRPLTQNTFNWYNKFCKQNVYNVTPGLTGIGSIMFRDEERIVAESSLSTQECYEQVIMPYKGELEIWYQKHISFKTDFQIILLTAWYVLNPQSNLVFKIFKDLPKTELTVVVRATGI